VPSRLIGVMEGEQLDGQKEGPQRSPDRRRGAEPCLQGLEEARGPARPIHARARGLLR
jgi:hypothetical protein